MAKLKLLLVDDDEDVRVLVSDWLGDDYDLSLAVDGSEALKKLKKESFDIILLDVMMPGPKIGKLVSKISDLRPKVMIIYLTAVEMFSPTKEQEKKGFVPVITDAVKGYLVKPVTKDQLIDKINEVLEREKKSK